MQDYLDRLGIASELIFDSAREMTRLVEQGEELHPVIAAALVESDELNRAPRAGMHFGFPYCHGGDFKDPEFGTRPCSEFEPPAQKLGPSPPSRATSSRPTNVFRSSAAGACSPSSVAALARAFGPCTGSSAPRSVQIPSRFRSSTSPSSSARKTGSRS